MTAQLEGPVLVGDEATLARVWELRATVWRQTGTVAEDAFRQSWRDEFDEVSQHWVVTWSGEVVAAARLSVHARLEEVPEAEEYLNAGLQLDGPVAAPARVVVLDAVQGRGVASLLIRAQDDAAVAAAARSAVRQASPRMRRLLLKRGWQDAGPAPLDPRFPGVEFQIMTRHFPVA